MDKQKKTISNEMSFPALSESFHYLLDIYYLTDYLRYVNITFNYLVMILLASAIHLTFIKHLLFLEIALYLCRKFI
jgi:hypothetical protein